MNKRKLTRSQIGKIAGVIAAVIVSIIITILVLPNLSALRTPEGQAAFKDWIGQFGVWGFIVMICIMILQIIVAFLPGEPLEILCGLLYGTWGGAAICLIASFLGSALVFFLVKKLGKKEIELLMNSERFAEYRFLKFMKNPAKRDSAIFALFFIIGTPKDVLTYFAPFTGINPLRFLFIATIAKIPSIFTSTIAGNALSEGNLWKTAIVFVITALLGLGGITWYNRHLKKKEIKEKNEGEL